MTQSKNSKNQMVASGTLSYLGSSAFILTYEGQTLAINPYFKWIYVGDLIQKKDPLQFGLKDNLKHKFSSTTGKKVGQKVGHVDFILINSPQFPHLDYLKELIEINPQILLIAPLGFLQKFQQKWGKKVEMGLQTLSIEAGETVRVAHFTIKAIATPRDRNQFSYSIQCGNLALLHSAKNAGEIATDVPVNVALLPLSDSRYSDPLAFSQFIDRFKPDLVIPFDYDARSHKRIMAYLKDKSGVSQVHFPQIGEIIPWN